VTSKDTLAQLDQARSQSRYISQKTNREAKASFFRVPKNMRMKVLEYEAVEFHGHPAQSGGNFVGQRMQFHNGTSP
jgi:hypothetical protein